jgi:cytosine-specific methyltransferase
MKTYNVVDLFCGCGGGAIGIERLGRTNTLFAIDFWKLAVDSYNYNLGNKAIQMDIHDLDEEKIKQLTNGNQCDILIGSPPCQGFSLITRNNYKDDNGNIHDGMEQKKSFILRIYKGG